MQEALASRGSRAAACGLSVLAASGRWLKARAASDNDSWSIEAATRASTTAALASTTIAPTPTWRLRSPHRHDSTTANECRQRFASRHATVVRDGSKKNVQVALAAAHNVSGECTEEPLGIRAGYAGTG